MILKNENLKELYLEYSESLLSIKKFSEKISEMTEPKTKIPENTLYHYFKKVKAGNSEISVSEVNAKKIEKILEAVKKNK
jgi:hypothetical protein